MKLPVRMALPLAALAVATACAPGTSDNGSAGDDKSGTLRVWLFQEVNNQPKHKVVDAAVAAFEKSHKGADVKVEYIPVETRAEKIKAAFNDPKSAPDVIEYGNTDTAGYVKDGGLADVSKEFGAWSEAKDTDPTAEESVTVDGKIYGAPYFVGVRALYYRTDVFKDLKLDVPTTQTQLAAAARKIHKEAGPVRPRGRRRLHVRRHALHLVPGRRTRREEGRIVRVDHRQPGRAQGHRGVHVPLRRRQLSRREVRGHGRQRHRHRVRLRQGRHGHRRRLQPPGHGGRQGEGRVRRRAPARRGQGGHRPAFAGGNNIGVLKSTSHRTLAVDLMKSLASKKTQGELFDAMGFLPTYTDVRASVAKKGPFVAPFIKTLGAGAKFVPASPAWGQIDASLVLPTMFQEIVSGRKDVATASRDAAKKMDTAFRTGG